MRRIISGLFMVAVALTMTGCPPLSPLALGTWLFTLGDSGDSVAAIVFLADGATETPDPTPPQANTDFEEGFVFLWAVDGSDFTLSQYEDTQQPSDAQVIATGTVANRRSIVNGTVTDGSDQPFTARAL